MERVYRGQKKTPPRAQFSASAPPKVKLQRRMRSCALRTPVRRTVGGKRLFLMDTSASSKSHPYATCPHAARCRSPSQLKSLTDLEKELFPNEACLFEEEPVKTKLESSAGSQVNRENIVEASQLPVCEEPVLPERLLVCGDEMNFREFCIIGSPSRFSESSGRDMAS